MLQEFLSTFGLDNAWVNTLVFLGASLLMIWRLEAMIARGLEGTALATVVTPFCSGLGNLIFVYLMARDGGDPREVVVNSLVNNVTNLTVLLGIPALFWGLRILPSANLKARGPKQAREQVEKRVGRLSLLLTLAAGAFFAGSVWVLGGDGRLDHNDGMMLVGVFFFWLCFQVFDVLKHNIRHKKTLGPMFIVDLLLLLLGAFLMVESLDWIVSCLAARKEGFFSASHLGWLTGWLMVLPNALLVFWYAYRGRADIAYASQIGDGHICIPLCLGVFAMIKPLPMPALLDTGMLILLGASALHFILVAAWGGLPRWTGIPLLLGYAVFVWSGLT